MMSRPIRNTLLLACLLTAMALGGVALAQSDGGYDLSWWTVDGGGGALSGGGYLLEGAAGQPDAGDPLSGGGYTLTGGFWQAGGAAPPPTCPDPYEPNEDFASAKAITPGIAIHAYICDANDRDWFKFNANAGQEMNIDLTQLPADYDLELYDPGNNNVQGSASGGMADEHIYYAATISGAYRVRVYGYGGVFDATNPYALRVQLSGGPAQQEVYYPLILK